MVIPDGSKVYFGNTRREMPGSGLLGGPAAPSRIHRVSPPYRSTRVGSASCWPSPECRGIQFTNWNSAVFAGG